MGNSDLWCNNGVILRILRQENEKILVIDCKKQSVPYWMDLDSLSAYQPYSAEDFNLPDISQISANSRKTAYDRFNIIAEILPTIGNKQHRCAIINRISKEKDISKQTINKYLWLYLAYQNISALAPVEKIHTTTLSDDEKNFRWGLNKFYYTQSKLSLQTAYTLMLKEKYYSNGTLKENYPSFYKFRYYYRKHKDLRNFYISRNGIKAYQKDMRPLLGDGIQEFANSIGFGMLDALKEYWVMEKEEKDRAWDVKYIKEKFPEATIKHFPKLNHCELAISRPEEFWALYHILCKLENAVKIEIIFLWRQRSYPMLPYLHFSTEPNGKSRAAKPYILPFTFQ